jgi:zinc/manganese transport system substrate-binding protein
MTRTVLTFRRLLALPLALLLVVGAACASSDSSDDATSSADDDTPTIVATHSILGDLAENVVEGQANVEVLMPPGTDPHDFEPSAQQIAELQEADLVVANGLGFEAGLGDALQQAQDAGVPVLSLGEDLDPIPFAGPDAHEGEDGEDEHADEEGDEHEDEELDPHWFTDPQRAAAAVDLIATEVAAETGLDVSADAEAYATQLSDVDVLIDQQLAEIPDGQRVLLTNHEVFGYFADRYGFEVVGVIIPGGDTLAEPSSAELAALVEEIEHEGVSAIFADSSSSTDLADTLAAETGQDVEVVALFTESLGEPGSGGETYVELIQTNADRITEALA